MRPKLEVLIASGPDRQGVYAEVWIDNEHWAEVFFEGGTNPTPVFEVYPHPTNGVWRFAPEMLSEIVAKINSFLDSMTSYPWAEILEAENPSSTEGDDAP